MGADQYGASCQLETIMTEWYYQVAGEVVGPVSLEALKQKAADGEIARETLVREGADGPWAAASDVEELSDSPLGPMETAGPDEGVGSLSSLEPDLEDVPAGQKEQECGVRRSPLALRPCLDCGTMVSKQADACPHCGRLFHESSPVVQYHGEHPIPVLVFFTALAILFVLLSPLVVYSGAVRLTPESLATNGGAGAFALLVAAIYGFSMIVCALLGRAVGAPRMASVTGLFLGLFFGPLGVFAACAIDKRPQCRHCSSRLDGLARECPHCHARLIWQVEAAWY